MKGGGGMQGKARKEGEEGREEDDVQCKHPSALVSAHDTEESVHLRSQASWRTRPSFVHPERRGIWLPQGWIGSCGEC
jgi:hypothetical protein